MYDFININVKIFHVHIHVVELISTILLFISCGKIEDSNIHMADRKICQLSKFFGQVFLPKYIFLDHIGQKNPRTLIRSGNQRTSPALIRKVMLSYLGKRKDCSESCYWLVLIFGAAGRLIKGASQLAWLGRAYVIIFLDGGQRPPQPLAVALVVVVVVEAILRLLSTSSPLPSHRWPK